MGMKQHILAAMHEQYTGWEALFTSLNEDRITEQPSSGMAIKDIVAHLYAWQQRSIARMEAASLDLEPVFPDWPADLDAEAVDVDRVNAWIYETHHAQPWSSVYQKWSEGFLHLIGLAESISEKDLLDSSRYPWMDESPLVLVLLGTYDHHQEHMDALNAGT